MKLVLADPALLKDSIAVISELVNEARFKLTRDGIELIAVDPANVAMVVFKLLSSCFTEYELEKDQEIAVNLSNLKQILRRVSASDIISLEVADGNKLKIELSGGAKRTFSIPLIELEEKEQRVPNLEFPVSITTQSSVLNAAISDADILAESVSFEAESEKFTIAAEGDLSKAKIEIKSDEETKISSSGQAKAKYSIEYLKKMISAAKIANDVNISFSQD
jgi:proliferating cell nuclear antigen